MGQMDLDVLHDLIEGHAAALELYARQWCEIPEDVVQEGFLKLVQQETDPDNIVAWLYRVVRNGAISAARSTSRRRRHEAVVAGLTESWFQPWDGAMLDGKTASEALAQLPVDQRETIVAHIWGGLTFEEIADLTTCSASTAHRRYVSGLSALRERLGVECPAKPRNTKT